MSNSIVGIWFSRKLFPVVSRAYAEPNVIICKYHLLNNASVWYTNQWLLTLLLSNQCYRQLTPEVMLLSMLSFFFSQHNLKTPCCFQDRLAWHKQQFLTFGDIMVVFIFGGGGGASFCNITEKNDERIAIKFGRWHAHGSTFNNLRMSRITTCFLLQYTIRRLIVRSRKASKPRDLYLELLDRSQIWHAPQQHWCWGAC